MKHHLTITHMVKKEDIYDNNILYHFAKFFQNQHYLNSLFLLTIADIKGTNPSLWTNWQQTIFEHLYIRTNKLLNQSINLTLKERLNEIQTKILKTINSPSSDTLQKFWQDFPSRYFTEQNLQNLSWQSKILCNDLSLSFSVIQVYTWFNQNTHQTSLLIISPNRYIKLSFICYLLYKISINITEASFFKLPNGVMLYHFNITNLNYNPLRGITELNWLKKYLDLQLQKPMQFSPSILLNKNIDKCVKNDIKFITPYLKNYTQVTINSLDCPGILANLCYFFEKNKFNIIRAKIHTPGLLIEDSFYITDQNDNAIKEKNKRYLLTHKFLKYLNTLKDR